MFSSEIFAQNAANSKAVLAQIGSRSITVGEFKQKYDEVKRQSLNPPTEDQFLEDLIRYHVGLLEADKKGLRNDPVVKDRIEQEVYKGLLEKELGDKISKIKVDEKEMKAWYQKNPEIRTSHILIEFKQGAKPEEIAVAKKRAEEILTEVKGSKRPFEELVKLYSDDPLSKQTGGDVGWQNRMTLMPVYYDNVVDLKVGSLSSLIQTTFGFHIVKLTGKRTYENANKRQIRTAVFDQKRLEIFEAYFGKVKANYPIKINKSALK